MKTLEILLPYHPQYHKVASFAKSVYEETLHVSTRNPPETMIAAMEGDIVHGCIGLNTTVHWHFFRDDPRFQRALAMLPPGTKVAEQSIFAIRGFPAGIPLLISSMAAYAEAIGISRIIFAGIGVSCRAIEQLGFTVDILGPTKDAIVTADDRQRYGYWLEQFEPITCVLDTNDALQIYQQVAARFIHKAHPTVALQHRLAA